MEKSGREGFYPRLKASIQSMQSGIRKLFYRFNHAMRRRHSPRLGALISVLIVLVMGGITLFVPPVIGVADDGSLSGIMESTGLSYRRQDLEAPVGAYFVRVLTTGQAEHTALSSHYLLIRIAMALDFLVTGDSLFDMRFLGLVYLLLYLPGVYLLVNGLLQRVKMPIEATFIAVLCGMILGDSSMTCYFNSLYPEALWLVCAVYILGFFLLRQHESAGLKEFALLGLTVSGCVLVLTESHLAAVGLILGAFTVPMIFRDNRLHRFSGMVIVTVVLLFTVSIGTWTVGADRFTEDSKLHAMTNGVLMRARNPSKALAEFGIDSRFETLTDTFTYDNYPYTLSGQREIQEDFLPKYNAGRIALYYLRHPLDAYGMLEIGTHAALGPARSYIGSYESSVGLPERARNPVFTLYGNFRAGSFPRTFGFLIVMSVIYLMLFRQKKPAARMENPDLNRRLMLSSYFCFLLMGMADVFTVILLSGTAELERYQLFYGFCIDMMFVLLLSEALHKLKILSDEENQ